MPVSPRRTRAVRGDRASLRFVVGAIINYILNYHFTFQSDKRHREALTKFLIVATIGAGINGGIMYLGVENTNINYLAVQIFATGVVLLWNFLAITPWLGIPAGIALAVLRPWWSATRASASASSVTISRW